MAPEYPHIFLRDALESKAYTTPSSGGVRPKIPQRDRQSHSTKLKEQWAAIWVKAKEQDAQRKAVSMPTKDGVYIEFEGAAGYDLVTKSLEDRRSHDPRSHVRLLNIYTIHPDDAPDQEITRATVFVPSGKRNHFLKKLSEYANKETLKGNPKHADVVQSVDDIRLAVLESFWRDEPDLMPQGITPVWCEIWLQGSEDDVIQRFRDTAKTLGLEIQSRSLKFPERTVLLGRATHEQLTDLIASSRDIAEFRRAKETARYFLELNNEDQSDWVNDLRARLRVNPAANVAVCVLDTGANNGHVLLQPVLADPDCHTVEPDWGTDDHKGHGTLMCGIAAYGELEKVLQHNQMVRIEHCLESVKILPPHGANDPELYGDITIQGISRAEIQAPQRSHIGCMAVTTTDGRDHGRPSSWSAAIDKLTSGFDGGNKQLFIVSAGNSEGQEEWANYPESNLTFEVHDPGQAWNALTVGAYTEKAHISDPNLVDHVPLAQPGELSPFSSTSRTWDRKWPFKPDIVMEGGNLERGPDGFISPHDDLSLLSTGHQPTRQQFDSIYATSAAAAQAAWMTAQIQARYPEAWPETIRGLMVHSAGWPDALKRQFLKLTGHRDYSKTDYGNLLRFCGYGVPNLAKALSCASNSLTLISEARIQPYTKKVGSSNYSTKDMHLHRLPWPREVLLALGEMQVELRITLSYFIEPGPGEVGWKDKYRYASYGLRFDLNTPGDNEATFIKRLNAAARDEEERSESKGDSERWLIGANGRNTGSIHSDIWTGTAADIAACNLVGVYPVIGWWRERAWLERWNREARYSLIVSLQTPDQRIDIYTPVAVQLQIPIEVTI